MISFYLLMLIFTDRVRSTTEGHVLTRVCPSICLSTPGGGVPQPGPAGGYPDGGGYPTSGTPVRPGQGVPHLGYTHWTWLRVPHLRYPLLDLDGGVPCLGYPPPIGPDQGGYPDGGTPPQVPPPSDLAGEVPQPGGGTPPSST